MPKRMLFFILSGIGIVVAAFAVALVPDAGCGSLFAPSPAPDVSSSGNECGAYFGGRATIFWILLVIGTAEIVLAFVMSAAARRRAQSGELV